MIDQTGARAFAASLCFLADTAEINADGARDQRISDAFTDAVTLLGEAAMKLRQAADDVEGVWELAL